MNIKESLNRTVNILAASIIGLAGFAFFPEVFHEDEWPDKIDDIFMFLIGLHAIAWYLRKDNRFKMSIQPIVLLCSALIIKIIAVVVEFGDKEATGDDKGAVVLFLLATILVANLYLKNKKDFLKENIA